MLPKAKIDEERRFRGNKSLAEIMSLVKVNMPPEKVFDNIVTSSDDRFYFIDVYYLENGEKNKVAFMFEVVCYGTRIGFYIFRNRQYRNYDNSLVAQVDVIAAEIINKIESRQPERKTKQEKMIQKKAKRRQVKMERKKERKVS